MLQKVSLGVKDIDKYRMLVSSELMDELQLVKTLIDR